MRLCNSELLLGTNSTRFVFRGLATRLRRTVGDEFRDGGCEISCSVGV